MGFRKDAYATVWSIEPAFDTLTKARISISRKDKQTGAYETDFSGFVSFVGTAAAKKATSLREKDRIRLGEVDVTTKYDKEKNVTYTNYKIFSFETQAGINNNIATTNTPEPVVSVDDGELDDSNLPF